MEPFLANYIKNVFGKLYQKNCGKLYEFFEKKKLYIKIFFGNSNEDFFRKLYGNNLIEILEG